MGGEGPYARFNPSYRSTSWADQTGLSNLGDEELDAAYIRCRDFLKEKARELLADHGWSAQPEDDTSLFLLTGTITWNNRDKDVQLRLPLSFSSFLNDAESDTWKEVFENYYPFRALRHNRDNSTLFIDSLPPISDIFYVLQTLAPGMLLIVRIDDFSDHGEEKTTRALPSEEWVKDHKVVLEHVLGSKQRYQELLAAVTANSKSFQTEWIRSSYDYDYYNDDSRYYTDMWGQRVELDYLACDSECGYCGRCDY